MTQTPISASVSFHNVTRIVASSVRTSGAPLTLTLSGPQEGPDSQVTIFTNSQPTTDLLIAAINLAARSLTPTEVEPTTAERLSPNDYRD